MNSSKRTRFREEQVQYQLKDRKKPFLLNLNIDLNLCLGLQNNQVQKKSRFRFS